MRNKTRLFNLVTWPRPLLIFLLFGSGCTSIFAQEPFWYDPLPPHEIEAQEELTNIWVRDHIFISDDDLSPMMTANQGVVSFLGGTDIRDGISINVIDAITGDMKWQRKYGIPTSIVSSSSDLYVGASGGASVLKLDLITGNLIWETKLPKTRGLSYLSLDNDKLYVQTTATTDTFFVLNTSTGEIIRHIQGTMVFLSTEKFIIQRSIISNEVDMINSETQQIIWTAKLGYGFSMLPIFTEREILILTDLGGIYCLERDTGNIKWHIENIAISNIALGENIVYFLTRDGKLQGANLQSGDLKSLVEFNTDRFVLNGEYHIGGYNVIYDQEMKIIFVHLGDSAQLFAFQISE